MAWPLDGYGQAGANDDQAAVYFLHQNGLIPPDFSDVSDSISKMDFTKYFLDGFHKIYLFGFFIVGDPSNVNQSTPNMPPRLSQIVL